MIQNTAQPDKSRRERIVDNPEVIPLLVDPVFNCGHDGYLGRLELKGTERRMPSPSFT